MTTQLDQTRGEAPRRSVGAAVEANATVPETAVDATAMRKGHVGRIVVGSITAGLVGAIALVAGPFAGAREHVITGSVLLAFAVAWGALAVLSERRTDRPQRWALAPAAFMALAGASILVLAPTGNELGWVWPPMLTALVVWMIARSRQALRSRTRVWVLYPVFAALLLSAIGGAYETYRETVDPAAHPMPGRLISVGDHKLHINCTGTGSPTVVLEPGLGEPSSAMGWIAPNVATTTRVCVYDRAGRGWSQATADPSDGVETATDLHTLLERAGERGPYVLAGHSAGGLYVLNFARLYPHDVAGVALLDSMHPEQSTRIKSYSQFYEMFRRVSAVLPSLSRLGVGRAVYATEYDGLPAQSRDEERAFVATPRDSRSVRDEFSEIKTAMHQAGVLHSLGHRPLVVLTARKDAEPGWTTLQNELAALSTDSVHRVLPEATHSMLTENKSTAAQSSNAIRRVVLAVRTGAPIATPRPAESASLLPEPSGPFAVGVRTVPGVSPDATTRLWYPARRGTGTGTSEYIDSTSVAALGVTTSQLADVHPRATVDAAPARTTKPRPAVVLMPGWGSPMAVSTASAQDLASHGYVVVAVDPNPGTEDGNAMPADTANPARRLEQVDAGIDFAAGRAIGKLAGPVASNRIAVGGHSIAGAIAFQVAITDPRVHAVFDLDGWLHGPALTTPVNVPALMVNASGLEPETLAIIARTAGAVTVKLAGATHLDVTDLPCIAPALGSTASQFGLGTIGCTATTTTNTVVLRFLDAVLRDNARTPGARAISAGLPGVTETP